MPGGRLVGERVEAAPVDGQTAGIELVEARGAVEQRRLPRAGRSHHGHELALRNRQIETVEGHDLLSSGPVDLSYPFGDENRWRLVVAHASSLREAGRGAIGDWRNPTCGLLRIPQERRTPC